MTRQRWGTFAVADHLSTRAFITEVFLYNRLVIPYPPSPEERVRWKDNKWAPGLLEDCLDILNKADLVEQVEWTEAKKEEFKSHYQLARQVSYDAMQTTRLILAMNKDIPPDVWPVAAYPNPQTFAKEFASDDKQEAAYPDPQTLAKEFVSMEEIWRRLEKFQTEERQKRTERLGWLLGHSFLVPSNELRNDLYLLREAVDLVSTDEFQEYRIKLYEWQDRIITDNTSDEDAIKQMQGYLKRYNAVAKKKGYRMKEKFAYTVVAKNLVGLVPGPLAVVPKLLIDTHNFVKFEQGSTMSGPQYEAAAMFHSIHKHFGWH